MWRKLKQYGLGHLVRFAFGIFFLILGLLGLVLPVLQGILFLAISALLLSPYIPFFRRLKLRLYWRFPRVRWTVERWRRKLQQAFHYPDRRHPRPRTHRPRSKEL